MTTQQPEALDLADWLEAVGGGGLSPNRCAALLREQHTRIAELESELEAVGAGGVQALSAARANNTIPLRELGAELRKTPVCFDGPEIWALFREGSLFRYLDKFENGFVDSALLAASPTPPAEQQAAPKAAPGDSAASLVVPDGCPHILWFDDQDLKPVVFAGNGAKRAALEAYRQASMQWNAHLFVRIAVNSRDCLYPCAAPQQEAQEPVGVVEHAQAQTSYIHWTAAPPPNGAKLYTAPQPAPAPLSDDVVKDAARWRWLRANWFTMTSSYDQQRITFKVGEPRWSDITEEKLDAAIDAARKQGASHDKT